MLITENKQGLLIERECYIEELSMYVCNGACNVIFLTAACYQTSEEP